MTTPTYLFMNAYGGEGGSKIAFWNSQDDRFRFWVYNEIELNSEDLDGKSYGIFHYTDGASTGTALMAGGNTHSLVQLILKANGNDRELYVDQNNDIDQWTFDYDDADDKYTLSVSSEDGVKYLVVDSSGISTTTEAAQAGKFIVERGGNKRIRLKSGDYYVKYIPGESGSFDVTQNSSDDTTWLWLLDRANLSETDLISFSADRVSVSDIQDGQKVIVYFRIWNDKDKKYDMFAVDHDGSLHPCYAQGGKIMWLGDGTGSLEWEFKEYLDEVTKEPNYYYELYSPYSELYFAPKMMPEQVFSTDKIGISLPGRKAGEFYSSAIAWDDSVYGYVGIRPVKDSDGKWHLEPCSQSVAYPLYFATTEELNLSDKLHEVPTLDNNNYGITMKMKNFRFVDTKNSNYGYDDKDEVTRDYFEHSIGVKQNLLSNTLQDEGYPIAIASGKSLKTLYSGADTVNKLFLERVYNSSGYFEFDSAQNFATLRKVNHENGKVEKDENGAAKFNWHDDVESGGTIDFTVFRELGTHDRKANDMALSHGQFFPYDTIQAGVYSVGNPLNTSDAYEKDLPEEDPRKYESLHLIQTEEIKQADYYFGMELSASFTQTASGLDNWGHDIIFEFKGDDDFWLYVDDQLVIDLGGTHKAMYGSVNFRTGDVIYDLNDNHNSKLKKTTLREIFEDNYKSNNPGWTEEDVARYLSQYFAEGETIFRDYSTHKMRAFYMERGGNASNLYMKFNLAAVTPGNVVVSKSVKDQQGNDSTAIDLDFVEYPFQIYYKISDDAREELLGNGTETVGTSQKFIGVSYQNSNQKVRFVEKYRPPGFSDDEAYKNVYFINPRKKAEISFPSEAISYRIVECAVDNTVYNKVTIDGEEPSDDRVTMTNGLVSYSSTLQEAGELPNISFDNYVNDDVIKDLYITKKLVDKNNNEVTKEQDPATFNFRLYISSFYIDEEALPLASMYKYYVLAPGNGITEKKLCRYDPALKTFVATNHTYTREFIEQLKQEITSGVNTYDIDYDDVVFTTSGFGAISGIPAGYTICVPGLPVGSIFKITEDTKAGYGLKGYECVKGAKTEAGVTTAIPSYLYPYEGTSAANVGKVIAETTPQMIVTNQKGYAIEVKKNWSDISITKGHDTIYTAVYVNDVLLQGSVKQIVSPSTSAYYFWTELQEGKKLDDYEIKEVTLENPVIDRDGVSVTSYNNLSPIENLGKITLSSTRLDGTPETKDYVVSYGKGVFDGTVRKDIITNAREGGIQLRLFDWGNWDNDTQTHNSAAPLSGGTFELKDESGNVIGTYTAAQDGTIAILYDKIEKNKKYTLKQKSAPKGYVGMQKEVVFSVSDEKVVSLFYNDKTTEWGNTDVDVNDKKWAKYTPGEYGIDAFIDIYNKPFEFKLIKMDKEDDTLNLSGAKFALYRQVNSTIIGLQKSKSPIIGFEELVTNSSGEVIVVGGDSGRTLTPGSSDTYYFLEEVEAPNGYRKLKSDIIFKLSPLGVPSLVTTNQGTLQELEDCYVYTLNVPNELEPPDVTLKITKKVKGNLGNKAKQFTFKLTVAEADPTAQYKWSRNGIDQETPLPSGGIFTLSNGDYVEIVLPKDSNVTVEELSEDYKSVYMLNKGSEQAGDKAVFKIEDNSELTFTNARNAILPTGIFLGSKMIFIYLLGILSAIVLLLIRKKRFAQK